MHCPELGIEIGPAAIAVESHGQRALVTRRAGSFDAHHAGFTTRPQNGVGLDHGVVLLEHPALVADVGGGQQLLQVGGVVARLLQLFEDVRGRVLRNRRGPAPFHCHPVTHHRSFRHE